MFFRKVLAFVKRDFLVELSYRLHFILVWLNIFGSIVIFYFITKLFGKGVSPYLNEYGGQYFPFLFIGIAFSGYLTIASISFSRNIRTEQMIGTLEAIFLSPLRPSILIISMSLWNFIFASLSTLIYFLFGILFFGINLPSANFLAAAIPFILTIISFSSIGIISASFVMIFKRGDPIAWAIGIFSSFLGGTYFPIAVLPNSLQFISRLLPTTYSLRALRLALLQGYSCKMLISDITILLLFCIILLPLSLLIFNYAVKKVKIEGSLTYY